MPRALHVRGRANKLLMSFWHRASIIFLKDRIAGIFNVIAPVPSRAWQLKGRALTCSLSGRPRFTIFNVKAVLKRFASILYTKRFRFWVNDIRVNSKQCIVGVTCSLPFKNIVYSVISFDQTEPALLVLIKAYYTKY